jgi:hypothetical protein
MKIGTLLEKIFKITGVQWIVKKIWGDDCGCDERRDYLDNYFDRK